MGMNEMARYAWIILGMLMVPQLSADQAEGPPEDINYSEAVKESHVSITASTGFNEEIAKLAPSNKKRVKEAADSGTAFIKLYLDGLVCMWDAPGYEMGMADFVADTGPIKDQCKNFDETHKSDNGNEYVTLREVCPQVILQEFKFKNDVVLLTYQMTIVGTTNHFLLDHYFRTGQATFNAEESGKRIPIVIAVNLSNNVVYFVPTDRLADLTYQHVVGTLDSWPLTQQIKSEAGKICR
jgi:hypothetical protein